LLEFINETGKDINNNNKVLDIKLLTITWNMARKIQQPDFNILVPNA
jgi:hypothetical protein